MSVRRLVFVFAGVLSALACWCAPALAVSSYKGVCAELGVELGGEPPFCTSFPNMNQPDMVAVSDAAGVTDGDVYVASVGGVEASEHSSITRFNAKGEPVDFTGSNAQIEGNQLLFPKGAVRGVAVESATGDFYVTNNETEKIERFDAEGAFIGSFALPESAAKEKAMFGIAVDESSDAAKGDIYVVNGPEVVARDAVYRFVPDGGTFESPEAPFIPSSSLYNPQSIAVGHAGAIYVANHNGAVKKFSSATGAVEPVTFAKGEGAEAVAMDPSSGHEHVFVWAKGASEGEPHVLVYKETSSTKIEEFETPGFGAATEEALIPAGLAVNPSTHEVYATNPKYGATSDSGAIFSTSAVPKGLRVVTEPATGVSKTGATLHATILAPAGEEVKYRFAWGGNESASTGEVTVPAGGEAKVEEKIASGLEANATYQYKALAEHGSELEEGETDEFTASAFTVETEPATEVSKTGATLHATLRLLGGGKIKYHFDYGESEAYGSVSEEKEVDVPASGEAEVESPVSALRRETAYDFKVVAVEVAGGGQEAAGGNETFTTKSGLVVEPEKATGVTQTEATLHAKISLPGGGTVRYHFEYGETELYGAGVTATEEVEVPAGGEATVAATVTGLKAGAGTPYYFNVVAEYAKESETAEGELPSMFTTLPALAMPEAKTGPAEAIGLTHAKLTGEANPGGEGEYHFEYGTEACATAKTPCETTAKTKIVGSTKAAVAPVEVTGLASGEKYYYQLVVENGYAGRTVVPGGEQPFETEQPVTEPRGAPRLLLRVQASPSVGFSPLDSEECFSGGRTNPDEFDEAGPCDQYDAVVTNVGAVASAGPVVIKDDLPEGLLAGAAMLLHTTPGGMEEFKACQILDSKAVVECEVEGGMAPDERLELGVRVRVPEEAEGGAVNVAEVSEAGAVVAREETPDVVSAGDARVGFGATGLLALISGEDGLPDTQAGGHPYELVNEFELATQMGRGPETARLTATAAGGGLRDVVVELPLGFLGSAQATPKCTLAQLQSVAGCPKDTEVGSILSEPSLSVDVSSPVWNLVPERGVAAELGFIDSVWGTHVIDASLAPSPSGYVLRAVAHETPDLLLWDVVTTVYGDPAAKNGGGATPAAMFTNGSDCDGQPQRTTVYLDDWQRHGAGKGEKADFYPNPDPIAEGPPIPDLEGSGWTSVSAGAPPVTGCEALHFEPSEFTFAPEAEHAGAGEPSGYESVLKIPQSEEPGTLATPPLKTTVVTLPAGVSISPSAANGLQACSPAQFGFLGVNGQGKDEFTPQAATCPNASQVGTVQVTTPLLEEKLPGSVWVAEPACGGSGQPACTEAMAESGELFGIYLEVGSQARGLHLKLLGKVEVGGEGHHNGLAPGQIRTSFVETPQAPVSELRFKFHGESSKPETAGGETGETRAPLANPQSCGSYTSSGSFEPWSAPQSGPPALLQPSFTVGAGKNGGCGGGFSPGFSAGTASNRAGAYTAFSTTLSRHDEEQDLSGLTVDMPAGLVGKVAGIKQCGESEANAGTCGPESKVGTATAAAGPGGHPFWQSGSVYLTGAYDGAPFGLSVVVPAVAGPYDLGDIVVRARIYVDPSTAQVTVVSNPLPQSVDGVPLRVQTINVTVGEGGSFTLNPTSCEAKSIGATIGGSGGSSANVSSRYQAEGCAGLPFHPSFAASTQGNGTIKGHGASLKVDVAAKPGAEANIAKIDTQLPLALSSRLTTLQKACTEAQFAANPGGCPPGSFVGAATVRTPLLNAPLSGPAILVSHGGRAFPDLDLVLQGEGVEILSVGNSDIKNGITYSKFETVPDAPVSSIEVELPEKEDALLGAVKDLCAPTRTVTVKERVKVKRHGHVLRNKRGKIVYKTEKVHKQAPETLLMPTTLTGQNGAVVTDDVHIAVSECPATHPAKKQATKKKKPHRKRKQDKNRRK